MYLHVQLNVLFANLQNYYDQTGEATGGFENIAFHNGASHDSRSLESIYSLIRGCAFCVKSSRDTVGG
jgi:hypothetical protein